MPPPALALLGGEPALAEPLGPYQGVGEAEAAAAAAVVRSGRLSGFFGSPGDGFLGGPKVQEFETAWASRFGVPHAVSVNSGTSGLLAALGSAGLSPGDEVIVPPLTMSATAVTPLFYGAVPVFADVELETGCVAVEAVKAALSPRTRVIVAVNLFGHPARLAELRALADRVGAVLIEDNAQALLAEEDGHLAGTVGHIGVFSLNYHKHIHTGEGGMCVTASRDLALKLRLIRNHGENASEELSGSDLTNLVGLNLRLTEVQAAIGLVQLNATDAHVGERQRLAERLTARLNDVPGLVPPTVRAGCRHGYYVWAAHYDEAVTHVPRALFSRALAAEGVPHLNGYVAPLYLLPLFQRRHAIGREGWPFTMTSRRYGPGLCPVAEQLHERVLIGIEMCRYQLTDELIDRLAFAFRKVIAHIRPLASLASTTAYAENRRQY